MPATTDSKLPSELRKLHCSFSQRGVFVDARRPVGPVAVAERDLAEQEVLLEFGPLLPGGGTHLSERAQRATAFDEELVRGDHLLGEDSGVAAGGVQG